MLALLDSPPVYLAASTGISTPTKENVMGSITDKAKGIANQAAGNVKQAAGRAAKKPGLEVKGMAQERKGEAQQVKGKVKAGVKRVVDRA